MKKQEKSHFPSCLIKTGHLPTQSGTAAAAASLQSCPTLCDPIDGSAPGSAVPGLGHCKEQDKAE